MADAIPANAKAALNLPNAKELEKNLRAFAQSIGTLRKPAELARAAAGLDPGERRGGGVPPD